METEETLHSKPEKRREKKSTFVFISVQLANLLDRYKTFSFVLPAAGFDPSRDEVHSEERPSETEEWLLLVDQTDQSHRRAVIIKNKLSGTFLAVQHGRFTGLTSYNEDCKWLLV